MFPIECCHMAHYFVCWLPGHLILIKGQIVISLFKIRPLLSRSIGSKSWREHNWKSLAALQRPSAQDPFFLFQRSINFALPDAENSGSNDVIAEDETQTKSAWKVIRSLRNKKLQIPPILPDDTLRTTDPEKAEFLSD